MHSRKWTKVALALSVCLFLIWWALGTGATLAWFSDTDTVRNEFQVGLLRLDVDYRNDIVETYEDLQGATKAFNDAALYEPGYTQVVYLRIDNVGDMPFNYKVAVTVNKSDPGRNAWGKGSDDLARPQNDVYVVMTVAHNGSSESYYFTFQGEAKNTQQLKDFQINDGTATVSFSVSWVKPASADPVGSEAIVIGQLPTQPTTEPATEATTLPTEEPSTETTVPEETQTEVTQ